MSVFQRAFLELNAVQLATLQVIRKNRLLALMLPRQVGKTHFAVWLIREVMRQNSNAQCGFFAKDFPSVTRVSREKFIKLFPADEFHISVMNGISHHNPTQAERRGACYLSGIDKTPDKLRGGTLAALCVTEAAFAKLESGTTFDDLVQQIMLPMVSRTRGMFFLESTPNGSNFWKGFWEADNGFAKLRFTVDMCIQMGVLTREEVDFMERNMHPDVFSQEMNCEFVSFQGKIYHEYKPEFHDLTISPPEPHERITIGVDIGYSGSNSSVLFMVWRKKKLHIFDQIYVEGKRHDELAGLIDERIKFYGLPKSCYTCYTDVDQEFLEEMQKRGIRITYADKVDRFASRMALKVAFFENTIYVDHHKCTHLKNELGAATWSTKLADEMEESGDPNKGHWDSEASLRYGFRGAKLEIEKPEEVPAHVKADANSMLEWENRRDNRAASKASNSQPQTFEY
jgi:hypothetical protein